LDITRKNVKNWEKKIEEMKNPVPAWGKRNLSIKAKLHNLFYTAKKSHENGYQTF
jgi:hypothetical protein